MTDELVCDGRGWYKTYRQIDEWEWYKVPNMFLLFSHLLNKANFEEKRWQGVSVKRGQLITSLDTLSEQTGISRQSVRTCLKRLISTHEITLESTHHYTLITINKYDTYQSGIDITNTPINTQTNTRLTHDQHTPNTNEEVKKEKNIKNLFIPPTLEQLTEYCKERKNNVDPRKWLDHYTANGFMVGKNRMKDWRAAVRTWEQNSGNGYKLSLDPIERLKKEMNLDNRADA